LGSKILDQIDLIVTERANLLAIDSNCTNKLFGLSIGTVSSVRAPPRVATRMVEKCS